MHEESDETLGRENETGKKKIERSKDSLTVQYVKDYLAGTTFDLQPTQKKISFPLIQRYIQMLKDGQEPPPIKTDEEAIVDGHHRYISGHMLNAKPSTTPYTKPMSTPIGSWDAVHVDSVDYEPGYDEGRFNKN